MPMRTFDVGDNPASLYVSEWSAWSTLAVMF
jgi:hypothetical protein